MSYIKVWHINQTFLGFIPMRNLKFNLDIFTNQYGYEFYQLDIDDHHKPICSLFLETDKINNRLFNEKQVILHILIVHNRLDLLMGV